MKKLILLTIVFTIVSTICFGEMIQAIDGLTCYTDLIEYYDADTWQTVPILQDELSTTLEYRWPEYTQPIMKLHICSICGKDIYDYYGGYIPNDEPAFTFVFGSDVYVCHKCYLKHHEEVERNVKSLINVFKNEFESEQSESESDRKWEDLRKEINDRIDALKEAEK